MSLHSPNVQTAHWPAAKSMCQGDDGGLLTGGHHGMARRRAKPRCSCFRRLWALESKITAAGGYEPRIGRHIFVGFVSIQPLSLWVLSIIANNGAMSG